MKKYEPDMITVGDRIPMSWMVGHRERTPICPVCEEIFGVSYALMWDMKEQNSIWTCCNCGKEYLKYECMLIEKGGDNMSRATWGKFWMVIGRTSNSTNHRHESLEEAKEEAERLCRQEKEEFAILEVVEVCRTAQAPVEWSKPKEKRS